MLSEKLTNFYIKQCDSLEKHIVILFSLLIPCNFLGRGLFNINLALILFFFILLIIKYKIKFTPLKRLTFIVVIFLFYSLTLLINFFNPTSNYNENIKLLIFLPLILYIANYIFVISQFQKANFLLFQKLFFYFITFISSLLFLSLLIDINLIYTIKYFRIIEFEHSVFHSRQNIVAACIAFYLSYYFNNKTKMNFLMLLLIYLGTFASHGRTSILVISFGTVIYMFYNMYLNKKIDQQKIYTLIGISFMSLFLILYISGSTFDKLEIHTSNRFDGWLLYLRLILEDHTIFGYGLQGGQYVYTKGLLSFKHPHNIFVESLFYLGLLGSLLLIVTICLYAYSILKRDRTIYDKPLMVSFFISVLVMEQAIGSLWGTNNIVPLVTMIYLSLNSPKLNNVI